MDLPQILKNAIGHFSTLPGIGEKTAFRQALFLTSRSREDLDEFGRAIQELADLKRCTHCGMFSDGDVCEICIDAPRLQTGVLCVVESVADCFAIEKTQQFNGLYHVLGGVLNPLIGKGPKELNLDNLLVRIHELHIRDVILAINPSVEGDATCSYIKQIMPLHVTTHRIGFGIPIGGSLEYVDGMTISKAFENKKII